jgi:hypothetical protein
MRKRLPDFQSVIQVYAVIAVMFAAWTVTAFLWKLAAWILFLNLGEIFTMISYGLATNFLESLIILSILLAACALLPAHLLRDDFVVRGTILSMGLIGSLMAFVESHMQFGIDSGRMLLIPPLVVVLLMGFLLQRSVQSRRVRSVAMWLSDRLLVFLFILLPLFGIVTVYVIFRNVS